MEIIKYELKYCERCGTLKLRAVASAANYCRCCERLLARFTFGRGGGGNNLPELPLLLALEGASAIAASAFRHSSSGRVQ
jgi:hypothetical protein